MKHRFGSVLLRRAVLIGERRAEHRARQMCDQIGLQWPDIRIIRDKGSVRLFGRGLLRRRWLDAGLRWLGRLIQ